LINNIGFTRPTKK